MKKTIAVVLSAVLVLLLFAACGAKEDTQDDSISGYEYTHRELSEPTYIGPAEGFSGGDGSEKAPYEISSAAELALLGELIADPENTLNNRYMKAYYVLTNDIQLNDTTDFASWSEKGPEYSWKTIDGVGIELVFDGKGHTVSGLYINADNEKSKNEYGLFGTFSGTVKNLKLDKSYISVSGNNAYVGAVAGYLMDTARIENCTVNATIECYDNDAGGIAGYAAGGFVTENMVETNETRFPVISGCTFEGKINQVKQNSLNIIGGIVGAGDCEITGCTNNGTISFGGKDIEKAGGIIGMSGFGKISGCVNNGEIICEFAPYEEAAASSIAGGIIGDAFQSSTGSTHMSRGLTIENCRNNGKVSAQYSAGGIAGEASNDHNEWCLTIKDCENSAEVLSKDTVGGIIGYLSCSGKNLNGNNLVVEECTNTAALEGNTPGGVIGRFTVSSGDIVIRDCENSGNITASAQNAGGIISYFLAVNKTDVRLTVEDCENSGTVKAMVNAGGIFAHAGNEGAQTPVTSSMITVKGCENSGTVIAYNYNGFIGGIAGNWGMENIKTSFTDCENSGSLSIEADAFDPSTYESEATFTLSRICGGIVGRVGSALLLTVDSDENNEKNINREDAVFVFENCENTGSYKVSDEDSHSSEDGKAVYKNFFGGIIGNTSAENGFSILVKDCKYSGFERGLGNAGLPDIGEKL